MSTGLGVATALLMCGSLHAVQARTITVNWPVNLTLTTGNGPSQVDTFETSYQVTTGIHKEVSPLGVTLARLDVDAGLGFPTRHNDTFTMSLPFQVSMTAPDTARAGSQITLMTSVSLTNAPTFTLNGTANFDTTVFAKGSGYLPILGTKSFDTGVVNLPDAVRLSGGSGLTFGGNVSYSASTDQAQDVLIGPFARTVPVDSRLLNQQGAQVAAVQDRFKGVQLTADGRADAWRGELNLLEPLKAVPVIGAAAEVADVLADLDLRLGADLVDRATLTTGAVYGLFSDNNGASLRSPVLLNGAFSDGVAVRIPTAATGQYELSFQGFGLGFAVVQQALMQANLDLVLDGTNPLPSWKILSVDFGGPLDLGRQLTRFSYYDFLGDGFSNPPVPEADRTLLVDILSTAPVSLPPSAVDPGLPAGTVADLNDSLGNGNAFKIGSTAPTGGAEEIPLEVPEPSSLAIFILASLVAALKRHGGVGAGLSGCEISCAASPRQVSA